MNDYWMNNKNQPEVEGSIVAQVQGHKNEGYTDAATVSDA
jgi:hypothetical protein